MAVYGAWAPMWPNQDATDGSTPAGTDVLVAAWTAWTPESRAQLLRITDTEVVGLVVASYTWLLTMEAQQQCLSQPLFLPGMPLVSAIQLDVAYNQVTQVRWPQDDRILTSALRSASTSLEGGSSSSRRGRAAGRQARPARPRDPSSWPKLLQPMAKSWAELEQQLARLIEQLVLQRYWAEKDARGPGSGTSGVAAAPGSGPSGGVVARGDAKAAAAQEDACEGAAQQPVTGRAAKRARQRERRRMFKRGAPACEARDDSAEAEAEAEAVTAEANAAGSTDASTPSRSVSRGNMEASIGVAAEVPAAAALHSSTKPTPPASTGVNQAPMYGISAPTVGFARGAGGGKPPERDFRSGRLDFVWQPPGIWEPTPFEVQPPFDSSSVEDPDDELDEDGMDVVEAAPAAHGEESRATAKELPKPSRAEAVATQGADTAPKDRAKGLDAETAGAAAVGPVEASPTHEDAASTPATDPWTGRPTEPAILPGVGRGRPMGEEEPQGWGNNGKPLASLGMGRGRALAPPPGLGPRRGQKGAPQGLSQAWIPPIPEDLDPEAPPEGEPEPSLQPGLHEFLHLLPGLRTPSVWSPARSHAPTPNLDWSKTPSSPGTPTPGPLIPPPLDYFSLPRAYVGQPPMYVTVPVAEAHSCPHCGRSFAMPPPAPGRPVEAAVPGVAMGGSPDMEESDARCRGPAPALA